MCARTYEGMLRLQPNLRSFGPDARLLSRALNGMPGHGRETNTASWNHMRLSIPQLAIWSVRLFISSATIWRIQRQSTPELLTDGLEDSALSIDLSQPRS